MNRNWCRWMCSWPNLGIIPSYFWRYCVQPHTLLLEQLMFWPKFCRRTSGYKTWALPLEPCSCLLLNSIYFIYTLYEILWLKCIFWNIAASNKCNEHVRGELEFCCHTPTFSIIVLLFFSCLVCVGVKRCGFRGQHGLQIYENRVLRKVYGPKRER